MYSIETVEILENMNIESLNDHINVYNREVVDSGFRRDVADYLTSIPQMSNNILTLRDAANDMHGKLVKIEKGFVTESLWVIFPDENPLPFPEHGFKNKLQELIDNTEIEQSSFYNALHSIIVKLDESLDENASKIESIQDFIKPYLVDELDKLTSERLALVSVDFKAEKTISNLKRFTKSLNAWNKILHVYHQLVKSDPPEDIRIVEIQNGSIDVIINVDVDVAIDLAEVIKICLKAFGAYLTLKKIAMPMAETYSGNKELEKLDVKRDALMLDNIGKAVRAAITKQHKSAKKIDKKIDGTAIPKKTEQVAALITSHIIQGNDVRLLALPKPDDEDDPSEYPNQDLINDLGVESSSVRRQLGMADKEEKQKLLNYYPEPDPEND